jgi:hypothetical protein
MDFLKEIELSISFGQKLFAYKKACIQEMCKRMDNNDKIRQHYESDRSYISDIVNGLERGEGIQYLYPIKKRLTIVGQQFFKNEFKELKVLTTP